MTVDFFVGDDKYLRQHGLQRQVTRAHFRKFLAEVRRIYAYYLVIVNESRFGVRGGILTVHIHDCTKRHNGEI